MKGKNVVSIEAVLSMMNDCYRTGMHTETGGILVGPRENKNVITHVIPSTEHAERRAATYYQNIEDVNILNEKLQEFQSEGYDFVGYYHPHPMGLYQLSRGDIVTCHGILKNPSYKIENSLLMVIIAATPDPDDFPMSAYNVSLNAKDAVVVKKVDFKILPLKCIEGIFVDNFARKMKEAKHANTCY